MEVDKCDGVQCNRRGLFESGGDCRQITFVPPQFRSPVRRAGFKEIAMNKPLVATLIAVSFISFEARAQERAGSAALGAVSGAVVLGPVGAVAGALIGYTAGPAIAHSWGVGRSAPRSRAQRGVQRAVQTGPGSHEQAAAKVAPPPAAKPRETVAANVSSSPPVAKTPEIVAAKTAPPIQGFE